MNCGKVQNNCHIVDLYVTDKLSTVFTPAANHPNTAVVKTQPWHKPIKYDFRILHWYNIDGFDYNCSS